MTKRNALLVAALAAALLGIAWVVLRTGSDKKVDPSVRHDPPHEEHLEPAPPTLLPNSRPSTGMQAAGAEADRLSMGESPPKAEAPKLDSEEVRLRLVLLLQERLRLETTIGSAVADLLASRFQQALDGARGVLGVQPDNSSAKDLADVAQHALDRDLPADDLSARMSRLSEWLADMKRTLRVEDLLMRWPSQAFWERVKALGADAVRGAGEESVRALTRTARVTLTLEDAPFERVVREFQAQTAVDIVLDPRLRALKPPAVVRRLVAQDMTLAAALDAIAADGDVQWKVDHAVVILAPGPISPVGDAAQPALSLKFYDVKDLVAAPTPPAVGPSPAPPTGKFESAKAVVEAVKLEVDPDSWHAVAGASITIAANGFILIVKATPGVQGALRGWFERQRAPVPKPPEGTGTR